MTLSWTRCRLIGLLFGIPLKILIAAWRRCRESSSTDLAVGFERGRRRSTDAREIHHVIEAVEVGRVTTIGELIAEDRQVEAVNVRARAHNPG